jgi:hypothetical protein
VPWLEGFRAATEFKAESYSEGSLGLLRARTGHIAKDPGAPIPVDPFTLFELGGIIIHRVCRICIRAVVGGLDYRQRYRNLHLIAILTKEAVDRLKPQQVFSDLGAVDKWGEGAY